MRCLWVALLFTCGCASHMTSWNEDRSQQTNLALEEMRIELADVKHALNGSKVDLQLLEEKIASSSKPSGKNSGDLSSQLAALDRKVIELQKNQERIVSDLKQLATHANQTTSTIAKQQEKWRELQQEISSHEAKLAEIVKLKGTLSSVSQMLKGKSSADGRTYKIKSGDSLEKIAKQQGTNVEAIKQLNDLSSDRIVVGQEIQLPDSP